MTENQPIQSENEENPMKKAVTVNSPLKTEEIECRIAIHIVALNDQQATLEETQAAIEQGYSDQLRAKLTELEALEEQVKELRKQVKEQKQEETPMFLSATANQVEKDQVETKQILGDLLSEWYYRHPDAKGGEPHIFGWVEDSDGIKYAIGTNWTRSNGWQVIPELAHEFLTGLTTEELSLFEITVKFKPTDGVRETDFNTYAAVNKTIGRFNGLQLKPRVLVSPRNLPMLMIEPDPENQLDIEHKIESIKSSKLSAKEI